MDKPNTWIKPQGNSGQPSFGFKQGIEIIQNRIRGVCSEPRGPSQRRLTSAEAFPMIGNPANIPLRKPYDLFPPSGPVHSGTLSFYRAKHLNISGQAQIVACS